MKALVLASGGVDSSTCLGLAVRDFGPDNVIALAITYGQKHEKEIEAARKVAAYYKVRLIEQDLTDIFKFSNCSLLQHSDAAVPEAAYADQLKDSDGKPVSTYVPFRNGLFLSSAAAIALSDDCSFIYYGAHSDDAAGSAYPDCSQAFNQAMNQAIYEGSGHQLQIKAPFIGMTKADVVRCGLDIGVPYALTWSCYEGGDVPCGRCGTCIDRMKAFEANGVKDPALTV